MGKKKGFLTVYGTWLLIRVILGLLVEEIDSLVLSLLTEEKLKKLIMVKINYSLGEITHGNCPSLSLERIYKDANIPTKVSICINNGSELKKKLRMYLRIFG